MHLRLKNKMENHEPGCSHVILRWKGHNQITVHLSAFPVCAAMTNTSLQHSSTKLVYNSSFQHSSPQHSFTTLLYKLHHNTSHGSDIPDDTSWAPTCRTSFWQIRSPVKIVANGKVKIVGTGRLWKWWTLNEHPRECNLEPSDFHTGTGKPALLLS